MLCNLRRYSQLFKSVNFSKPCNIQSGLAFGVSKVPTTLFVRAYARPKKVKPEPEPAPETPSVSAKWKMIKVKHGRSNVVFPIIGNDYTFLRVIEDAVRHWKLSNSNDYELCDEAQKFTWPYSETVLSHFSQEETIVKLVKKKNLPKVAEQQIQPTETPVTKFIETVSSDDVTPHPPLLEESVIKNWVARLQDFYDDEETMEKIKSSHFYFPTESHLTSAFEEFSKTTSEKLRLARLKDKDQFLVFLPLLKTKEELPDEDFFKRVLPVFFSYVNSNLNVPPNEKLDPATKKQLIHTITNLREPHNWFPYASRKIILHVGPTNSGKTHTALDRLSKASSGIYCGPLRLLAQEIHHKMNQQGVKTRLITGQQRVEPEGAEHTSCTIEMADMNKSYEVGVIDEIQMIGSPDRGWAWTRALLGLPVKELHLCGDPSTLALIQRISSVVNEEVDIRTYQRLSPLIPLPNPVSNPWEKLRKGDCVVAFSRKEIYRLKAKIERSGKKCCVIYGNLPPDSRTQQAALFNDPDSDYDVLVASDAIGMGLNLNIKRLIFSTMEKFDGERVRNLTISEIKQIAGRAGRFGSQFPKGEVVCTNLKDNILLHEAIASDVVPINTAGLFPNYEQLEIFYRCLKKNVRFTTLLDHFADLTILDDNYFLSDYEDMRALAAAIEHLPLSLKDRYTFCIAPVNKDNPFALAYFLMYASSYVNGEEVKVDLRVKSNWKSRPRVCLMEMESAHHVLDLYIWLSFRFDEFTERSKAYSVKSQISDLIDDALQDDEPEPPTSRKDRLHLRDNDIVEFDRRENFKRKQKKSKHFERQERKKEERRSRRAAKRALKQLFV